MNGVPATRSEWLRSNELVEIATNAVIAARWGDLASVGAVSSPLALRADARAEALRQLAFFDSPLAVETIEVPGRHAHRIGTALPLFADEEGYREGPLVFVIGAEEREGGVTLFTVLRKIGAA
ncbi:hypothetical protein MKP08_08260 [Erythrobacter sp. LQ02-29]|uniref:hypothetical protein n=1 Tax=Erythrobacter sp. LQ02-29 TaxID=2920384 RepID=UPI001F4D997B|nr:hypothetical protein [Erythrobacter sp. LQ02-29]MCP9222736.1 hypothetical protein [Erythrobacter sp. LQ02-29]